MPGRRTHRIGSIRHSLSGIFGLTPCPPDFYCSSPFTVVCILIYINLGDGHLAKVGLG